MNTEVQEESAFKMCGLNRKQSLAHLYVMHTERVTLLRAENLGLQMALPKTATSQLHHSEPNPGSFPGALDGGQRQA